MKRGAAGLLLLSAALLPWWVYAQRTAADVMPKQAASADQETPPDPKAAPSHAEAPSKTETAASNQDNQKTTEPRVRPVESEANRVHRSSDTGTASVKAIADAITELDIETARSLLETTKVDSASLSFQRARLALYVGDCDSAEAILAALPDTAETLRHAELARTCARATAGSLIVEDKEQGVWLRLQDEKDRLLAPLLVQVAVAARETMVRDLGVSLPRPLRIDLVRDLFSLASVSGLPVEAAETTGTVAVARWGRVTMISPRAARYGYPWQDTLAHEITHLALSRGSRDFAPLWLQEGIAKREEQRWRSERPFDDANDPHQVARQALLDGTSVGIDRIGPSIAMLPSPQAAAISYSEVESFMDYWIEANGRDAFTLLLLDLRGLNTRETDGALLSVTGFPLKYWIAEWQKHLLGLPEKEQPKETEHVDPEAKRPAIQSVRLGDLLRDRSHTGHAAEYFDDAVLAAPEKPAVRFRSAAAHRALGASEQAHEQLGTLKTVAGLHGSWLGLHGRMLLEVQNANAAEQAFELALSVDPFGEEAACEGMSALTYPSPTPLGSGSSVEAAKNLPKNVKPSAPLPLPNDPIRKQLCEQARSGSQR